jgi:hypothetical protein
MGSIYGNATLTIAAASAVGQPCIGHGRLGKSRKDLSNMLLSRRPKMTASLSRATPSGRPSTWTSKRTHSASYTSRSGGGHNRSARRGRVGTTARSRRGRGSGRNGTYMFLSSLYYFPTFST